MELLGGVGLSGYRSFFSDMQLVGPLLKVNLLAGQNNAGKSNIVRFIVKHLKDHKNWRPEGLDAPRGVGSESRYGYALRLPSGTLLRDRIRRTGIAEHHQKAIAALIQCDAFRMPNDANGFWVRYTQSTEGGPATTDVEQAKAMSRYAYSHGLNLESLSSEILHTAGGGNLANEFRLLNYISGFISLPRTQLIDTFRRIGSPSDGSDAHSVAGAGLIEKIAALQNPDAIDQAHAEEKYAALNNFVSEVFDEPGTRIEVPHNRLTLNIRTRMNQILPLANQGTGIHQVIILAALATTYETTLVAIEEPEINLHPILQRRLLKYLYENTTNQYLITTHSAQLLDYERANVFHLTLTPEGTKVTPATTPAQVANICHDLGYRPSDLLQSNAIIWVEGPSDRIYVNHWIKTLDTTLVEGIHYSVMFYGGSLLSELSVDDPVIGEFINLRRLNRNVVILIDSDRSSARKGINETKKRVVGEFSKSTEPGFAWVTHGYTIENYVPDSILAEAVRKTHPRKKYMLQSGRWENPLGKVPNVDKVGIARAVVAAWNNCLSDSLLRRRATALVAFIRQANASPMVKETTS